MALVAEVIINRPAKQLNRTFSYEVPERFGRIPEGSRVAVPLGGGREEGIIFGYAPPDMEFTYKLRPIIAVLDEEPWFTPEMRATADRLSRYYLCALPEAYSLFTIDKKNLKSYARPKEQWLSLQPSFTLEAISERRRKQRELAQYLQGKGPVSVTELKRAGFSLPVIRQVMACSGVAVEERYTNTKTRFGTAGEKEIDLTKEQQSCYAPVEKAIAGRAAETFLLHGITGSGKTQIYMKAAQACMKEGRVAVVLVPEIILTDQIVRRFVRAFGSEVVVFHSRLTQAERYNNWERIRRKDSHIIIGARSAVFAPAADIGLIILDEEHDNSYKQEDMVRYHARKVAQWRAQAHSCPVLLGSATPSMESYYRALRGDYQLLELKHRIFEQPLPEVHVVDMKEELFYGNRSVFSSALSELIRSVLAEGKQMILLLNRRGYSTFVLCRECGKAITCPHCDVAMVYHQENEELRCHYCDHHEPVPSICPYCGSKKIKFFGTGTQKVEEFLHLEFPNARTARLDQDVTGKKGRGEELLAAFAAGQYNILLGTQMVAKGHDFPNVTGVGILTADSVLNIPLYTAAERTFDLLTQAAGRAGRGQEKGKVVIQTYNPLHYAIIKSKTHDYQGFYEEEIKTREVLQYPPCGELIHIMVRHKSEAKAQEIAQRIVADLMPAGNRSSAAEEIDSAHEGIDIIGPYEEGIRRIRDMYRMAVMVRGKDLTQIKETIYNSWIFTQEGVIIDVDPV